MRESIADILDREHRGRMARNKLLVDDWFDDGLLVASSPVTPPDPGGYVPTYHIYGF